MARRHSQAPGGEVGLSNSSVLDAHHNHPVSSLASTLLCSARLLGFLLCLLRSALLVTTAFDGCSYLYARTTTVLI